MTTLESKAEHGTRSRYTRGCRCDDCRAANTAYMRDWELRAGVKKYGAEEWERIRPRATDNPHGSVNRYAAGCRCRKCRNAQREDMAARRAENRTRPIPRHVHGTGTGYGYWGCRCKRCRVYNNDRVAAWKRQHSATSSPAAEVAE